MNPRRRRHQRIRRSVRKRTGWWEMANGSRIYFTLTPGQVENYRSQATFVSLDWAYGDDEAYQYDSDGHYRMLP